MSLHEAAAELPEVAEEVVVTNGTEVHNVAGMEVHGEGPLLVREKVHAATPMTLDQALHEMELVGHDFFLFMDSEHGEAPAVVYRRKAYDYGVIRLENAAVPV